MLRLSGPSKAALGSTLFQGAAVYLEASWAQKAVYDDGALGYSQALQVAWAGGRLLAVSRDGGNSWWLWVEQV